MSKSRLKKPQPRSAVFTAVTLLLLAAALEGVALWLGVVTYASEVPTDIKLLYCLRKPAIVALNLIPPLLLLLVGWLATRRAWAGCLLAALPTLALGVSNLYKVALRGDPVTVSDLRLLRTAGGIVTRYQLTRNDSVIGAVVVVIALLALSRLLLPPAPMAVRSRLIGLLACCAVVPLLLPFYVGDVSYALTENNDFVAEFADSELYASRGTWYSFLHTAPDLFSAIPSKAMRRSAERTLSRYEDADIPEEQKVQVVGVMLEAFCDLTDYPVLAANETVAALYEPLHELEQRCVSGRIITNIFAGGTVESEWNFLTGYSHHGEFTVPVDTYVRYFKAQGYDAVFQHPGYSWFYDRRVINENLGFDRSVFTEDGFGELVDPDLAPYRSDGVLFDYLLRSLDERRSADAPLFSFSVTYQNHGPYSDSDFDGAALKPAETGWTAETCGILSHYLYGVENTIEELRRFTDELDKRKAPVVAVFFGDHKPWLGNQKSVYNELKVNMDLSTEEGLRNFYATPYLIYANRAAKRVLGQDFTGKGDDFSPCLLMEELFDRCGWKGPAFMQLARDMRAVTPLLHVRGAFLVDGQFLAKYELPEDVLDYYLKYREVEEWRERYALEQTEETDSVSSVCFVVGAGKGREYPFANTA